MNTRKELLLLGDAAVDVEEGDLCAIGLEWRQKQRTKKMKNRGVKDAALKQIGKKMQSM